MADLLLLLETSGEHCSVAVAQLEGTISKVLAEAEHTVPMKHTAMLLPLIKEAFAKTPYKLQDTAAVAVSTGPGSYTALRAGYSSAKGLCLALDIPLITVSTLRAIASIALDKKKQWTGEVLSMLPARRNDVYFARFDAKLDAMSEPICEEADENWWREQLSGAKTLFAGPDVKRRSAVEAPTATSIDIVLNARNLLPISTLMYLSKDFAEVSTVEPNYVKPPFITKAKPRFVS